MEEGGVGNERIPTLVGQVPIFGLEEENGKVLLLRLQIPPDLKSIKCLLCPKILLIKGILLMRNLWLP